MSKEMTFVGKASTPVKIETDESGPIAIIGEKTIPVIDSVFDVQVVQPGSIKQNKDLKPHLGKFYFKDLETSKDVLLLLPLKELTPGRRLYPPFDSGEKDLLCYSVNGETPSAKVEAPISERCGSFVQKGDVVRFEPHCPKAVWEDGKKPECSELKRAAFYDIETNMPLRMSFSGTGISAWNNFQKEYRKHKNIVRLQGKNLADYVLKVTLENEGTYYRLVFKFEEAPALHPALYRGLMEWYVDNLFTRQDQQQDEPALGGTTAAAGKEPIDVSGEADASVGEDITL
jgi:hypothetical protein